MADPRHFASSYLHLLKVIHKAGGVACEDSPDLFFPEDVADPEERLASTKAAKALCKACPITEDCMTYALETDQRFGVWGGTSPEER